MSESQILGMSIMPLSEGGSRLLLDTTRPSARYVADILTGGPAVLTTSVRADELKLFQQAKLSSTHAA